MQGTAQQTPRSLARPGSPAGANHSWPLGLVGWGAGGGFRAPEQQVALCVPFLSILREGHGLDWSRAVPSALKKKMKALSDPANPQAIGTVFCLYRHHRHHPSRNESSSRQYQNASNSTHTSRPCFVFVGSHPWSPHGASGLNPSPQDTNQPGLLRNNPSCGSLDVCGTHAAIQLSATVPGAGGLTPSGGR